MKIKELTDYLESIAPLNLQEEYDNAGLIVGNPNKDISAALISLDCTEAVVEEAMRKKCDIIISHHPIVFRGLRKLNDKTYIERVIATAIKNGIAIYAIHTNLDNVKNGVNKKICDKLGLVNTTILSPKKSDSEVGAGAIGDLPKPMGELVFLNHLKEKMQAPGIRYTRLLNKPVQRVAVCGGSGSFLLQEAIRQKADVFITGDFKYHQFFDAENQLIIADIGHYESEQFTGELIGEFVKKKFSIFAVHLTDINTNPINYL